MNEFMLNPLVCPASLGEDDKPVNPLETAHKWDETTDPVSCSECGTFYQP